MNINELDQFNLQDAVKFHNRLNPRLWGRDEHLLPEVREKLLAVAADFQEFLGVNDLDVEDITVSGSNAAYSYTPASDIDLHIVVRMPEQNSEVFQELFNAKKYQYNDEHDIRIGGADVELYVQPADQTHHSLGIYSVKNGDWVQVPRRRKIELDDQCVAHKTEDLAARIDQAVASGDEEAMQRLWDKIKTMRQTGLDQAGEFGCDNLVFKMLRRSGHIEQLKQAKTQAHDLALSLAEREKPRKKFRYGFLEGHQGQPYSSEDGVAPSTQMFLNETDQNEQLVNEFIKDTVVKLGINRMPTIHLHRDDDWSVDNTSFGMYVPETHELHVNLSGRHLMDILRTTAHELVHCKQHEISELSAESGNTGSPWENEANAVAGVIMRNWANSHPEMFDRDSLEESSGYIPTRAQARDPRYSMALTVDIKPGQTGKEANKMALKTNSQGKPALLMKTANLREARMPQPSQGQGQYRDLNKPLGPETPPTMPAGTVKVDVSDVYDWYKLGSHISNLKGLGKHDFGAGPPSTIISFGDEETEHKYIQDLEKTGLATTDIDPKDPKQPPGMKRQKTDPTYNVDEAFDQPYKTKLEKSKYGDVDMLAKLPDGTNLSIMFNNQQDDEGKEVVQVEFYRNNSQEVTGEGDAQRIFATVLTSIQKYIKKYKPSRLSFSASKATDPTIYYEPDQPQPNPESRAKLYDRLVQRYARAWGYRAFRADTGDLVIYELSRLQPAVAEDDLVESLRQEFALLEDEYISEIKMTGKNLRAEAAQTGAQAGMEFEMIVPNVETEELDPEYEPDYDQDQRTRSFSDIRDFFHDGDYNGRREADNLMEEIQNEYEEWQAEQTDEAWARDGVDYMRDFVEVNDLFDRSEFLDQARDEVVAANPDLPSESEDFQQLVNARLNELQEQFVLEAFEDRGSIYNDALQAFAEEQRDEYDERSFLDDKYPMMTDIQSNFDISWPHYYNINDGQDSGDVDVDQVADEFGSYMGKPVNASRQYHGGRREAGTYVVEPDGSLEGDNPGDGGLEFVSPPMPIDEMISDLNKVKAWADKTGCYTNDSTGLHINISVPNYSIDKLDYVKLAILMGDEYILDLFGRSGNTYAKSAMGKIKSALKQKPEASAQIMDLMKQGLDGAATKAIHTGITDKYTSINTKTGYIEFRSPGGDWLDSNFDKIENTLLRFTVALSAAINPEAYRKEYLTKLYKLLSEGMADKSDVNIIQLFSNYSAGELDKAALIRQVRAKQLARDVDKGKATGKMWWNVSNPTNSFASIEVVAGSKEEAIDVALQPSNYPNWASARNTLQAKPLRPYQEPESTPAADQTGNWGIWIGASQRFARAPGQIDNNVLRRFPTLAAAEQYLAQTREENPRMRTDVEVREIEPQQTEQPIWYVSPQGNPGQEIQVRASSELNAIRAAGEARPDIFGNTAGRSHLFRASTEPARSSNAFVRRGEAPELYGVRTRQGNNSDAAQGGLIDVPIEIPDTAPRTLTRPGQGQQQFTGTWRVLDPEDREIYRFSGVGNNQSDANRVALNWMRQNPGAMQAGVTVVPEMT